MNCESYILLLDEYLNNELEEKLRGSVSSHLAVCEICREEIRFLESESGFYREIGTLSENNFTDQWEAMRNRLVTESLITNDILPKRNEAENRLKLPLLLTFFVRLENSFLGNRAAFGALVLIIFGFISIFLLTDNNAAEDEQLIVSNKPKEMFKPETAFDLLEDDISQPEKPDETNNLNFNKKPSSAGKTYQKSSAIIDKKKTDLTGVTKKNEKSKSLIKPAENKPNTNSSYASVRLPVKNNDSAFQTARDDKKLAVYLNKVHVFLLMVRNLENDETINAVLGDKYQTEAVMFLAKNDGYKKDSFRNKNIPAAELLSEIEPVLRAVSNLDNQSGKDKIDDVAAMVKQTGVVFKMRLWMSNVKSENEKSL